MRLKGLTLLTLLLLLAGCGYSKGIAVEQTVGVKRPSSDPTRYGSVQVVWVREYQTPTGLLTFPDGGKARDVAVYGIVYQYPPEPEAGEDGQAQRREIGRIELEPVRPGDYGNLGSGTYEWVAPDRLSYRKEYGYPSEMKVAEGELQIPPLP